MITQEMREILEFLSPRNDYLIFAGYLLTKVEPSADVDIFVPSKETVMSITEELSTKGWTKFKERGIDGTFYSNSLEKNNTTFDIIFSSPALEVLMPRKVKTEFEGKEYFTLSKEGIFLTKMNILTNPKRTENKTKRDREVINILREQVDLDKVRELVISLKDSFWRSGYF